MMRILLMLLIFASQSVGANWAMKPEIMRVYDGDTFTARFNIWINQHVTSSVRVLGVDTPELGYRAKCESENEKAIQARDFVIKALEKENVLVDVVGADKYGGRVDAWVYVDGVGLDKLLIEAGLGRLYLGKKRKGWCE